MAAKKKSMKGVRSAEDGVESIDVRVGDTITVITRVKNLVVPYNVSYDGKSVLFSLVSGATTIPVGEPGIHTLRWRFNEALAEEWKHALGVKVNEGVETVLLSGSQAPGDAPKVAGKAFVVVGK